jgi:carbonic anhydrase/acetyltransferase-like protein (isoleucine patch superfamily)
MNEKTPVGRPAFFRSFNPFGERHQPLRQFYIPGMIRKNPSGDLPVISVSAFVDPTAILCGKVIVEDDVFIGPYAVIRADETDANGNMDPIIIGAGSNIQDGVVIHSKDGAPVTVGKNVSIAHRAIVHGPVEIGDNCFIGFNAVVFNCKLGESCVVRHNSVVEDVTLPPLFHIPAAQSVHSETDLAKIPRITTDAAKFSESVVRMNNHFAKAYKNLQNEF